DRFCLSGTAVPGAVHDRLRPADEYPVAGRPRFAPAGRGRRRMMEIAVLFIVMFALMALGASIFVAMLIAVLVPLIVGGYGSATIIPAQMAAGVDSYQLLAIPFFILMGSLMARAGLTERIVAFLMYFIGGIKGGLAHTAVGASAFASTVSGSAPASASMRSEERRVGKECRYRWTQ